MYQLSREQKIANLQEQIFLIENKIERLQTMKKGMEAKLLKLSSNSGATISSSIRTKLEEASSDNN